MKGVYGVFVGNKPSGIGRRARFIAASADLSAPCGECSLPGTLHPPQGEGELVRDSLFSDTLSTTMQKCRGKSAVSGVNGEWTTPAGR